MLVFFILVIVLQFLSGHHIVHIKYGQFYLSILLQQIL